MGFFVIFLTPKHVPCLKNAVFTIGVTATGNDGKLPSTVRYALTGSWTDDWKSFLLPVDHPPPVNTRSCYARHDVKSADYQRIRISLTSK